MNSQLVIESISLECDPFSQLCPEHESEKNIVQLELPQIGEMIPQVSQTGSLEDGRNGLAPRCPNWSNNGAILGTPGQPTRPRWVPGKCIRHDILFPWNMFNLIIEFVQQQRPPSETIV
jgi:hypothetical protein